MPSFIMIYSGGSVVKKLLANVGDTGSIPGLGRSSGEENAFMHWRRKWQPTPVFVPGESQGQGSLVGYKSQTRLSD